MRITHNGRTQEWTSGQWADAWELRPEQRPAMEAMAREGAITDDNGVPLSGRALQRVRDRLLETYDDLPWRSGRDRRPSEARRWLIPGLWPWGTIPMLGGNPKAGKSSIIADLAPSLVVPDYRFLDHFGPADVTAEERGRGVLVINAETPPEDFLAALDVGMTGEAWTYLDVQHLEDWGGAQVMDLTDPVIYDMWAHWLADCHMCDGSDDWVPFAVIVDGLTAILHAAGKGTEGYGQWNAAFRRLIREVDIPNALVVAHNTLQGAHLMGGAEAQAGADGLWTYSSDNADRPDSPRTFSVRPRMGGTVVPPLRVVLREDGRPVVRRKGAGDGGAAPVEAEDHEATIAQRTAAYVREHPGADGQQLTDNVEDGGWKANNLKGRAKALELGLIREERCTSGCSLCPSPHHRRRHYWPVPG